MTQSAKGQFVHVGYDHGRLHFYTPIDPNEPHDVYRLIDPRDRTTRYIGISLDAIHRYKQHLKEKHCNPRKVAWIRELQEQGLQPILDIIEQAKGRKAAKERERHWINVYGEQGSPLLNIHAYVEGN